MPSIREINIGDAKVLFDWANDPEVRKMSINNEPILWNNHVNWLERKLADKTASKMFMLEDEDDAVGQIRFEFREGEWLIGYSIGLKSRGKGYGKEILRSGIEQIQQGKISGYVKPENSASVKIFLHLGFLQEKIVKENHNTLIKFSLQK